MLRRQLTVTAETAVRPAVRVAWAAQAAMEVMKADSGFEVDLVACQVSRALRRTPNRWLDRPQVDSDAFAQSALQRMCIRTR